MIIARCPDRSSDEHDNFHLERQIYLCFEGSNDLMKIYMVRIGKHLKRGRDIANKIGQRDIGKTSDYFFPEQHFITHDTGIVSRWPALL
jgi:hypothetical protein